MTDVSINAYVRGALRSIFAVGAGVQPQLADGGEQLVAEGLPPLTDIVRQGRSYQVALATGVAALTALPTTTAGLSLWNGESGSNAKSYVIESFGSWEAVTDATQNDTAVAFAMNNVPTVNAPTNLGLTIRGLSGNTYGGVGRTLSGATVVNDGWFPHGAVETVPTVFAGTLWRVREVSCRGLYIVRPGGQFNIQAVKSAAAAAAQQFHFIRWHEVQLALG